jgi:hypothetical protein
MIPSTRFRPSSMPQFYVFAFSSSRYFGRGQKSTQLHSPWRMVFTRLVGSSLLTTVASGLFFGVAQGEGKISIILPCALRLRNNPASCQQMSLGRVLPKTRTSKL